MHQPARERQEGRRQRATGVLRMCGHEWHTNACLTRPGRPYHSKSMRYQPPLGLPRPLPSTERLPMASWAA